MDLSAESNASHAPPTPPTSSAAGTPVSSEECIRLLSHSGTGQLVLTLHALPMVLPVRFTMDFSGALIVSLPGGGPSAAAIRETVVVLHAEHRQPEGRPGGGVATSVMVHARAETVPGQEALRLVPDLVTGTVLAGT